LEIIKSVEDGERGYYTGIYGFFDGTNLDSAVAIRFLEKKDNSFFYRSGGGITAQSNCKEEFQELLDKIYVPTV
jgi:para-aminobenzoate synthetase component 1